MNKKGIRRLVLSLLFILTLTTQCAFAHSGRTDSSGGHKDNKNKSGLGYYHYHCGGHPAHLHNNGVCPYSNNQSSSNTSSSSTFTNSSNNNVNESAKLENEVKNAYTKGFEHGSKCEKTNNIYTSKTISESYNKGYEEGINIYIKENKARYTKFGQEDASRFYMRSFDESIPDELREEYIKAYNDRVSELKKIAYDNGYMQSISGKDIDYSMFKSNEEIEACKDGYNAGENEIEEEKNIAYECGYNEKEYSVPKKFVDSEEVILASYKKGTDDIAAENEGKGIVGVLSLLLVGGVAGVIFAKKRKKA